MQWLIRKKISVNRLVNRFWQNEKGDLGAAAWIIGIVVVAVVVILVLKALAPQTATNLWNTVWTWVQSQFGIN